MARLMSGQNFTKNNAGATKLLMFFFGAYQKGSKCILNSLNLIYQLKEILQMWMIRTTKVETCT